jgi:hypothetical protein
MACGSFLMYLFQCKVLEAVAHYDHLYLLSRPMATVCSRPASPTFGLADLLFLLDIKQHSLCCISDAARPFPLPA